jgi:hypothetical protein
MNPVAIGSAEDASEMGLRDTAGVCLPSPDGLFRNDPCSVPSAARDTHDWITSAWHEAATRQDITR